MIGRQLMARVESYRDEVFTLNPMFRAARLGRVTAYDVRLFLFNVKVLLQHTPPHLRRAKARARALGMMDLAQYFATKLGEEVGHDAWADADLGELKKRGLVQHTDATIVPGMLRLLRHNEQTIDKDPTLYLAHILFAEYFTVIATPPFLAEITSRCGIPAAAMTAITNHAELDKEHVREWEELLPKLVSPALESSLLASLESTIDRYQDFCAGVMGLDTVTTARAS